MTNSPRYKELEQETFLYTRGIYKIQERIQTDWENNKEQLEFLRETFGNYCEIVRQRIDSLEEDKKLLQELANKYGVELE